MTLSADLLILAAFLCTVGAFSGVISGLLGIGGGIFLVPAFHFAFTGAGFDSPMLMQVCVATSTATIVATSLRSASAHAKRGAVDMKALKSWGPCIAVGAIFGVIVAASLKSATLMLIFGCIGVGMGIYMLLGKPNWKVSDDLPGPKIFVPLAGSIGFVCAMMGIGGGTFGVPALSAFGRKPHTAIATSAGFGLAISAPAAVAYMLAGQNAQDLPPYTIGFVNLPAFALITAMTAMTVPVGVRMAHALPAARLRLIFACIIILMAGNMLRKALMG